jgi:hypothetical protein
MFFLHLCPSRYKRLGTNNIEEGSAIDESKRKVGKVVMKKFPTLWCAKIGIFMRHIPCPIPCKVPVSLCPHKRMLSKLHCYNKRHKWYEEEDSTLLKVHRDYAEPIQQEKDMEIQVDNVGYMHS